MAITDVVGAPAVRIAGLSDDENVLVNGLLGNIENLRLSNMLKTSYYEHKRTIRQVGTLIPPQYFSLGLSLGWAAKAVDALARRCNLDGFVWPDGDLGDIGGDEVFEDNHFSSEVDGAIVAAMQHGPSFLVNTIGAVDEPRALIHVKDATEATGTWNRRRRALDDFLSIIERDGDGLPLMLVLYLNGVTVTAQRDKVGLTWQVDRVEHAYGVPADVVPYKPAPKRPFGQSRITQPIMGLQDAAVRELIRLEGHMDTYSYPEYWMLGADESVFKNANGVQKTMWEVRLGRIKGVPDDQDLTDVPQLARADVKQFAAASPEAHWSTLNGLSKMFAREAQLPDSAVAVAEVTNPTSADSYDASQYELIAEAEGAVGNFTPPLRRTYVRGLAMLNGIAIADVPDEWRSINAKWRNPRFLALSAQADAGAKIVAANPALAETEVGLELSGLDPQQVKRAMSDIRRNRGRATLQALVQQSSATSDATTAQ